MLPLLLLLSLALFLVVARTADGARARRLSRTWDAALGPGHQALLEDLQLAVDEHRIGLDLCARAREAQDGPRLVRAARVVAGFARGVLDGLQTVRTLSRALAAMAPVAPVAPFAWRSWRLRGLAGLGLAGHGVLVAAAERFRLRTWILGRGLVVGVRGLVTAARRARSAGTWAPVDDRLHDLAVVGTEAEATYRHLAHSLEAQRPVLDPAVVSRAMRKL